eukprot:7096_1
MANELQEFLKLLGRIITWIFKATLNLICFCLFVVSLFALWRTYWIIKHVSSLSTMKQFRSVSATHFGLVILDLLVLPFAVVALLIPTRTYHIIKSIHSELNSSNQANELQAYWDGYIRWTLFINFWIGIFGDMFCLFFGLLSMLIPTRTIAFFNAFIHHFNGYKQDDYCDLRTVFLSNFAFAILDILAIIHGVIALLLPTRTYLLITQFQRIRNDHSITYQHPYPLRYTMQYRTYAFRSFYLGALDLFIVAIALLSCVFLVRINALMTLLGRYSASYQQDDYHDLRIAICINCALSMMDVLCLFAGIIVLMTCIRTYPLISTIRSHSTEEWKPKRDILFIEYGLDYNITLRRNICKHFAFLFIDILFVPLLLVCLLSVYQGIEIYHLIRDAAQYDEQRMNLIRKKVIINFVTLVCDVVLMTPLMIITIVTVYRLPSLYRHIRYNWNVYYLNRSMTMHYTLQNEEAVPLKHKDKDVHQSTSLRVPTNARIHVCLNALVILGDIIFIVPCVVLLCVTFYRIPYLFNACEADSYAIQDDDDDYMDEYEAIYDERYDLFITTCLIFLDIPCAMLCFIIFLTVWRSFKLYDLLRNDTQNASQFRKHSFFEFIYLVRDIVCLIPLSVIVVTLFRLPMIILKIMSKLRTPRTSYNETQLKIEAASLEFQEKGKPRIWIHKATKNAHFALNNDTAKKGNLRLFVLGDEFWNDVGDIFGSAISTAGQSMLPNKLSHGTNQKHGLNYGTSNGLDYDLITDGSAVVTDVPFMIQQFIGKRSTILKNLNKFGDMNRQFLFQLEHDEHGILFVIAVSIHDLIECAQSESGYHVLTQQNMNFDLSLNDIHNIRGNTDSSGGIVDMFWVIVTMEFVQLLNDLVHLLLFLVLICVPWRCVQCIYYLVCDEVLWSLYHESCVIGVVQHSYFIYIKLYDLLFEPMLNDMVKMSYSKSNVIQYDKWCTKMEAFYNEYQDALEMDSDVTDDNIKYMNFISLGLSTYDLAIKQTSKKLKHIKPSPPTKPLIMDLFDVQNTRIYLKIMQSKSNILMLSDNSLKPEDESVFLEQLHAQQNASKQRMLHLYEQINKTYDQRVQDIATKHARKRCGLCSKSMSVMHHMIRFFVYKAVVDLLIIVAAAAIIFLFCLPFLLEEALLYTIVTVYYICVLCLTYYVVPFRHIFNLLRFKYHVPTSGLRFGFKQILLNHAKMIVNDALTLCQFIMYSVLIIITLVRLFEFISELVDGGRKHGKTKMTLRLATHIARGQAAKIGRDLYQLLNLFFMWKSYKFAIASLVFGVLLPAAGFIQIFAMICGKCRRKVRQIAAIMLWFGFLVIILIITTTSQGIHVSSLYRLCFVSLAFCCAFFVSLFVFIKMDKADIQRHTRSEYHKIDYNDYYIDKLCNVCNTKCVTLQNTSTAADIYCTTCSRYLHQNRSYFCSKCDTFWCINCGNVVLQSIHSVDDAPDRVDTTNSMEQILWSFGSDEFVSSYMRLTWPNVVAVVGVIMDVSMMCSILFYAFYIESTFSITPNYNVEYFYANDPVLRQYVQMAMDLLLHQQQFTAISSITLVIGALWVILVSLPLVCEQLFGWVHQQGTFTQSTMWIKATWIYQTFFVVLVVFLTKLFQCTYVEDEQECIVISSYTLNRDYSAYSWKSIMAFVFVIFFWFTSSICNVYNNVQICWSSTDHLDIRYPLAFVHGLQLIQSVFIVSGMLLIVTHVQIALLMCCVCAWLMLFWNVNYHWISRCMMKHKKNPNMICNFTSISYFICFQIMMYCLLTYVSTVLYVYIYVVHNAALPSISRMIQYGCTAITILGLLVMFVYRHILQKQRLRKLHESQQLNKIIAKLTRIYEETSRCGSIDPWYDTIGRQKLQKFSNNPWSTSTDLTYLLIEFERHILYNRLDHNFLRRRNEWMMQLLFCDSLNNDTFDDFLPLIDRLSDSVTSPPFFTLYLKALCQDSDLFSTAPLDICFIIMDFIVPSAQIRMIANQTLLDVNQFPDGMKHPHKKGIIKRMIGFGQNCDTKLNQFVQDIALL